MKQTTRTVVPALLVLLLLLVAGNALASEQAREVAAGEIWSPPRPAPELLAQSDPRILEVLPIQAIAGEPLVIGKSTVVRVRVAAEADGENPLSARVDLLFDGQELSQEVTLTQTDTLVDFFVEAPEGDAHDIEIAAELQPGEEVEDGDTDNNRLELSWPTVLMPERPLQVFYLPVDWSEEQKAECEFDLYFDAFVEEDTAFTRVIYPLPDAQVISGSTHVSHMLSEDERRIMDSDYVYNNAYTTNLQGSAILAAKAYAPDAELVAAVMPPRWLDRYANPRTAGFAGGVRGVTIVLMGSVSRSGTVIAHEYGHLRQLIDDYSPVRRGYPTDRMGYWVARRMPIAPGVPYSFMGSSGGAGVDGWIDSRSYEHLLAKYVSEGGEVSRPMVLAATLADWLDENGAPTSMSAGARIFEPESTVRLSVAHSGLRAGTPLTVRWIRAGEVVKENDAKVKNAGFGYTTFQLSGGKAGLALGDYRFELLSGDEVLKEGVFTVEARWLPPMGIELGDNEPDRSAGYRAGIGISPVAAVQKSVFVPAVASDVESIYGWLVAVSDGASKPRDFNVDLRFVDPNGKEYTGQWVDDGKVRADSRLAESAYARKRLKLAGTPLAKELGTWTLVAYAGGNEVGSTTFVLAARGAASDFDRSRDAALAAGINFIDARYYDPARGGSVAGQAIMRYYPPDPEDPFSAESMAQVWAALDVLRGVYPQATDLVLLITWSERYSLAFGMPAESWEALRDEEPSWEALSAGEGVVRSVYDIVPRVYLTPEQTQQFYLDRFGRWDE